MTQTKPEKITLELTFDEAWNLKSHLIDSSCYWHRLWQDAMDGKRPELDAKCCQLISKRAQDFFNKIEELGVTV